MFNLETEHEFSRSLILDELKRMSHFYIHDSESRDREICSLSPADPKPRKSVLVESSSNLPETETENETVSDSWEESMAMSPARMFLLAKGSRNLPQTENWLSW
jgi:hypothetical protein